jgi:hypothetical protein
MSRVRITLGSFGFGLCPKFRRIAVMELRLPRGPGGEGIPADNDTQDFDCASYPDDVSGELAIRLVEYRFIHCAMSRPYQVCPEYSSSIRLVWKWDCLGFKSGRLVDRTSSSVGVEAALDDLTTHPKWWLAPHHTI